jgi:hypothetical protein
VLATIAWNVFDHVTTDDASFTQSMSLTVRVSVAAMFFSIPGASLVAAVESLMRQRRLREAIVSSLSIGFGAAAGEAFGTLLGLIPGWGALYGFATAISLVALGTSGLGRRSQAS